MNGYKIEDEKVRQIVTFICLIVFTGFYCYSFENEKHIMTRIMMNESINNYEAFDIYSFLNVIFMVTKGASK